MRQTFDRYIHFEEQLPSGLEFFPFVLTGVSKFQVRPLLKRQVEIFISLRWDRTQLDVIRVGVVVRNSEAAVCANKFYFDCRLR